MGRFGTGQAIRRKEDQRFLTGSGRYSDDITLPEQAHLYFLRSPYAHGEIRTLETADAKSSPGVLAVYTAEDLERAGVRDLPGMAQGKSSLTPARDPVQQPPLARVRVRYVGEPVAAVVAESIGAARDAAELIWFDVDEIDAVVDARAALEDGAPELHPGVPQNLFGTLEYGDRDATDAAFRDATTTVSIDVVNNRLAPTAMEPRGCNVTYDGKTLTVYQGCQGVHYLRDRLAGSLPVPVENMRVVCPDVGGAFGLKSFLQCETVVAAHAAMDTGRPVKWTAERTESFLADLHGRDHRSHAELALDGDGRFLAMRVSIVANNGAYCSQAGPIIPWFGACMSTGVYDIPVLYADVTTVFTNTVPTDAYRGAGRPEAAYLVERLVDRAARQTGIAPDELRRRNFIAPALFPYRTATGREYDSGEYEKVLDAALERAAYRDFGDRREESRARGRLRGIGISYYVEICAGLGGETTRIFFEDDGRITVLSGTQSSGQGHETSYAQMVAAELGVDVDRVDVVQGDTARIPDGEGTGGSRSMVIGGSAVMKTVESMLEQGRQMAGEMLEAASDDIEFDGGEFTIAGTDRRVALADVAAASFDDARRPDGVRAGLYSSERFEPEAGTFPNGCHVCEVEIDPDTGITEIVRYTIEDDIGVVINPLILEGQIVGGVVQGLGQAAGEHAIYDADGGQLVTATFMDYVMPRAEWFPDIDFRYQEIPSPRNPLGLKGAGEAGTVGAAPAYVNAVLDALASRGIEHVDMPVTPLRVWQALHAAR